MLTPQEKQIIDQLKLEGKTPAQISGYIGGLRTNAPSTISRQLGESPKPIDEGVFSRVVKDIPSDIVETAKNAFGATNEAGRGIIDTFKDPSKGIADKVVTAGGQAFKGIGRFIGETFLGAAKTLTTDNFEKQAAAATGELAAKAMDTDLVKNTISWYEEQSPEKKQMIDTVLGYAEGLTSIAGGSTVKNLLVGGANRTKNLAEAAFKEVVSSAKKGKVSQPIRLANEVVDETTRSKAIDNLAEIYKSSMVENRMSINNKLDDLAASNSFGDKVVTRETLVRNLAAEGYVPDVQKGSRLADFREVFNDIDARQSRVMEALKPVLENSDASVKPMDFFTQIKTALQADPRIISGLSRADSSLETYMNEVIQKFPGNKLTASNINDIRKNANANTKAFKDSDKFEADLWSLIGKESRKWLEDNIPDSSVKKANAEWARLNTIRETAEVFNNQQIDVGVVGQALRGYMTVMGGTVVGGVAAGPIGAMTVGILTKMGADALADSLRARSFGPQVTAQIRQTLRQDDEVVQQLLKTASEQNKKVIQDFIDDVEIVPEKPPTSDLPTINI